MVAEIVYYFLLPEVEKQTIREKGKLPIDKNIWTPLIMSLVKHSQRKHLLATHRIIHKQLGEEGLAKETVTAPTISEEGQSSETTNQQDH